MQGLYAIERFGDKPAKLNTYYCNACSLTRGIYIDLLPSLELVKGALNKTIGNGCQAWKELEEVLLDVEITLNNRPLGYVKDDIKLPVLILNSMLYLNSNKPEIKCTYCHSWIIVGPLYMSNDDHTVDCNRILVKDVESVSPSEHHFMVKESVKGWVTPEVLNRMFELEFNELRGKKSVFPRRQEIHGKDGG